MRSRRRKALWVGVVWALVAHVPALAAPAFRACSGAVQREGRWTVLEPPAFEHNGIATLTDQAVQVFRYGLDPADRRVIYISNNEVVKKSTDGGCSWEEVFRMDAALTATAPGAYCGQDNRPGTMRFNCAVTSIDVVRPTPASPGRVYLQVSSIPTRPDWMHMRSPFGYPDHFYYLTLLQHQRSHGYALSWVFVSEDGGGSWSLLNEVSAGLGTRPGHGDLVVNPGDPASLYLVRHGTADGEIPGYLLKSEDGGETWDVRGPIPAVNHLAVNPYQAGDLWALSPLRGLLHSSDDGGSWEEVTGSYGSPADMAVFFGKTSTSIALAGYERDVHVSDDGGETWVSHDLGSHLFPSPHTPGPRPPFVGYEFLHLPYSVEIVFGSDAHALFVASNSGQAWVGRLDTRTGSMPFVRNPLPQSEAEDEHQAPDDDLQARLERAPQTGVSILSHCYANYACSELGIYRGPGA